MPGRPLARHLADLCRENAEIAPEHPAVISGDTVLTYGDLAERVDRFAVALSRIGVGRGGKVGLLCTNRWEWPVVAIAATALGARVAAFNTFAKAWDLEYMIRHSEVEVLVTIDSFRSRSYTAMLSELIPEMADERWVSARFPHLREVVVIGDPGEASGTRTFSEILAGVGGEEPYGHTSAVDDAFVLYTSGSTARPKAVPMQHYALIENAFAIGQRMRLRPTDHVFAPVPLFWAYGAVNALPATLSHGATLVLQAAFTASEALDLIEQHACTVAYTLPNLTDALLSCDDFRRERTATLRTGLTLGTPADVQRAGDDLGIREICNLYGGTETYGNCCVTPSEWPLARKLGCQGPPLPGVAIRIVGENGAILGPGVVGEIHVSGYVTPGYLEDASTPRPVAIDGWFPTGDLGMLDENGWMHFESRATEMIKTSGINVAPREVEEILLMHPGVLQAAVTGVPDEALGEAVVAFVLPRLTGEGLADELRVYCQTRVASYKVPARIHIVDELPTTDTGKLPRRVLPDLDRKLSGRTVQ